MISLKSHYGLKAIVALAANYGKGPVQAKEIASSQGVPVRYLELLLSQLRRARMVEATRGKNGGYVLAKDPSLVTVWDIVSIFEGKALFSKQADDKGTKNDGISFVWKTAEEKLVEYLASIKMSDLLERLRSGKQMYFI
jgi:Rrf2 family protein